MTTKGILGRKVGMTQVFTENGELIPVTVIKQLQTLFYKLKQTKQTAMKPSKLVLKINVKSCQTNLLKVM